MEEEKITYRDVEEYDKLFALAPSFLLERFAKKNTNIVLKFESNIKGFIANMDDIHKHKLDLILNSSVEELQAVMAEAYEDSGKKQYKILSNPKYREFIEINLNELETLVKKEKNNL